jgi:peptide-methionine (S)-S-oxide reductase
MTKALIGAGCFWGIEEYYRKINGVLETKVGYSGGHTFNPTYEEICTGLTEHVEVVLVTFDEKIISYNNILNHFWLCHDPTQLDKQGADIGRQYRSAIFYYTNEQKTIAIDSKKKQLISKNIATEIIKVNKFYIAEDYHQLYICKKF